MGSQRLRIFGSAMVSFSIAITAAHAASRESVIYSPAGNQEVAPVVSAVDDVGNLYGADLFGGASAHGAVFELTPGVTGWSAIILYSFSGSPDGQEPIGVIPDGAGNLWGATHFGGIHNTQQCTAGCGTIFELSPSSDGAWTERIIYDFTGGEDGGNPVGSLIFDSAGNLFGVTTNGGPGSVGVVFELSCSGDFKVLHHFQSSRADGAYPQAGVTLDAAGNLYGTAPSGGIYEQGVVFRLTPSNGQWEETLLYEFGQTKEEPAAPFAGVTLDAAGNIYGAASAGGYRGGSCSGLGCGMIYELVFSAGEWKLRVLYKFKGPPDASSPDFGPVSDKAGNLYLAANGGSDTSCQLFGPCGAIVKLTKTNSGWSETILHSFSGSPDGNQPDSGLIYGKNGELFGSTDFGGILSACTNATAGGCGVVYRIQP